MRIRDRFPNFLFSLSAVEIMFSAFQLPSLESKAEPTIFLIPVLRKGRSSEDHPFRSNGVPLSAISFVDHLGPFRSGPSFKNANRLVCTEPTRRTVGLPGRTGPPLCIAWKGASSTLSGHSEQFVAKQHIGLPVFE
ncbi:hypothetical protein AVEN_261291-1 [Araneus ventricosus]|uniref:Uncharacterized protein n=1 Tax=Araneus ventricosus TaxID=182803 RepID=A0A4Y2V8Y1_ARAVE|nr:hypothetical protein AVEN_261291-1 [Araneus ventricosus]